MWLAAALDCDGEIALRFRKQFLADGNYFVQAIPRIGFTNTNVKLTNSVAGALRLLTGNEEIYVNSYESKRSTKPYYQVAIGSFIDCKVVLEHIVPFLIAKKDSANLLKQLVTSRLSQKLRKTRRYTYSKKEKQVLKKLRDLQPYKSRQQQWVDEWLETS